MNKGGGEEIRIFIRRLKPQTNERGTLFIDPVQYM